jgi:hypothetical protein
MYLEDHFLLTAQAVRDRLSLSAAGCWYVSSRRLLLSRARLRRQVKKERTRGCQMRHRQSCFEDFHYRLLLLNETVTELARASRQTHESGTCPISEYLI